MSSPGALFKHCSMGISRTIVCKNHAGTKGRFMFPSNVSDSKLRDIPLEIQKKDEELPMPRREKSIR